MPTKVNDYIQKQIVNLYRAGKKFTEIADVVECSPSRVSFWLRKLGEVKDVDVSGLLTLKQIAPQLSLTVTNLFSLCQRLAIRPKAFQNGANWYSPEQVEQIRKSDIYALAKKTTDTPKPKPEKKPNVPKYRSPKSLGMLCRSCRFLHKDKQTVLCQRTRLTIEDYRSRADKCGCHGFQSRLQTKPVFIYDEGADE